MELHFFSNQHINTFPSSSLKGFILIRDDYHLPYIQFAFLIKEVACNCLMHTLL